MKDLWKGYLFILISLIVGFVLYVGISVFSINYQYKSILTFVLFIIYNISLAFIFKLRKDLADFWNISKIYHVIIGAIAGLILGCIPLLLFFINGNKVDEISFNQFSISSLLITLIIVSSEELWFRGIFLNYVSKFLNELSITFFCGFLFVILHVFNPEINLLIAGPELFVASSILTMIYFKYRNIYIPIGFHFGNNYLEALIKYPSENSLIAPEIIKFITLLPIFIYFVRDIQKSRKQSVLLK